MTTLDYCRYYDLETYLFEDVSPRFRAQGYLDAFDFFSIVVWKANRAKSIIAKKLLKLAAPDELLDDVCHRLSSSIYAVNTDEERFKILFDQPWSFPLPMASAILTVLYPDNFTVYDYRVCDELEDFHKLYNITNTQNVWSGYLHFRAAVEASSSLPSLRDKDRALIGKSMVSQLKDEIREGFKISKQSEVHRNNAPKIKAYAHAVEAGEERTYSVAEVFPEYLGQEQRIALRAYRTRENLTQKQLAELTGIPQHQISEMENGKRTIGKERARKLAEALRLGDWRMLL